MPLLEIKDLTLDFVSGNQRFRALDGVSLQLDAGETLCLVGESGCGKSLTGLSIARLVPAPSAQYTAGQVLLNGADVLQMSDSELRKIRGRLVSYVFQDPGASLNPVFRVGAQVMEALALHRPEKATEAEVLRLLRLTGIAAPEHRVHEFPFRLSGGMQQRVMLAMALACEPKLLVADEPTTALDVTIQAQILDLLRQLRAQLGMATLLITHNMGVVAEVADRVAVMYAGEIIETGTARDVLRTPLHPYTQGLLRSLPRLGGRDERLSSIPGTVPRLGALPQGCQFAPRCAFCRPECTAARPVLRLIGTGRTVRCPFAEKLGTESAAPSERQEPARPRSE